MRDFNFEEVQSVTNAAGDTLYFTGGFYQNAFANYGALPINWQTRQGYLQNGATVVGYRANARQVSLNITSKSMTDRNQYWEQRRYLYDFFRPNIINNQTGSPITLTVRQPDNTEFELTAYYSGGLEISNPTDDNDWRIQETVALVAYDPVWRKSSVTTLAPAVGVADDLVFPFDFPFSFDAVSGRFINTGQINYQGTWKAYPTIAIDGAYTVCNIVNFGTGAEVSLQVPISLNEQRTIALSETNIQVIDGDGNSRFDELSVDSNLVDFYIPPVSSVADNRIQIQFIGGDSNADATITYNEAYFGI